MKFHDMIAEAVHRAVMDFTGDDGAQHCDLYALAGTILLCKVTGDDNYQIQLGSLKYLADPPGDGWFEIDARNGGLDRLEYHAWIGKPGVLLARGENGEPDQYDIGEFIDFSVRHFRKMVNSMQYISSIDKLTDGYYLMAIDPHADVIQWTRPNDPPFYLWTTEQPPDEYRYVPDLECTLAYYQRLEAHPKMIEKLGRLVAARYREVLKYVNS